MSRAGYQCRTRSSADRAIRYFPGKDGDMNDRLVCLMPTRIGIDPRTTLEEVPVEVSPRIARAPRSLPGTGEIDVEIESRNEECRY
jgi:hypothetical protein